MKLVKAVQTCFVCPSQWDAWDEEGHYWYLRFRFGKGTATHYKSENYEEWESDKRPGYSFTVPDEPLLGFIRLEEFCEKAGIKIDEACDREDMEWD